MKNRFIKLIACLLTVIFTLSACQTSETKEVGEKKPIVYASFFPIYDLLRQVAGDTLDVRSFMPTNTDLHTWEPTARSMKELAKADLLFVNGANMERWVESVKENFPKLKVVSLADKVQLITYKGAASIGDFQYLTKINAQSKAVYKFEFGHTHEDVMRVAFIKKDKEYDLKELINKGKKVMAQKGELIPQEREIAVEADKVYTLEMGHVSGRVYFQLPSAGEWYVLSDRVTERLLPYTLQTKAGEKIEHEDLITTSTNGEDKVVYDPHSWLSLANAKRYLNYIYDTLQTAYPENKKLYAKRKFKAIDKLTSIQAQYKEKFLALSDKSFLVTHYAWEYLAKEFGLMQYPLQGLISTESPSLKTIKKAIQFCKDQRVNTVFYESSMQPKEAMALAEEIPNGKVDELTSMEFVDSAKTKEIGSYTTIMESNLKKLYASMRRETK